VLQGGIILATAAAKFLPGPFSGSAKWITAERVRDGLATIAAEVLSECEPPVLIKNAPEEGPPLRGK